MKEIDFYSSTQEGRDFNQKICLSILKNEEAVRDNVLARIDSFLFKLKNVELSFLTRG